MAEPSFALRLRKRLGAIAIDNFFRGISRLGALHPRARLAKHSVEKIADIPYRDGGRPEHLLDIYRPTNVAGPLPVVLYIHGGGFRILSKDTHWVMALAFARRGYLVFNMSYRLAPQNPFPAAVEDVCDAYRWVVDNAAKYGGDLTRLAVAGESAGANLATVVTLAACFKRPEPHCAEVFETGVVPAAVLPVCGIYQVSDPERFGRRKPGLSSFLRDRITEVSDSYLSATNHWTAEARQLADPLLVLESGEQPARTLPPFFTACGTADPILDDTRRLVTSLQKREVPVDAHYYPKEPHAFHALVFRAAARDCWRRTHTFLSQVLTQKT